MNLGIIEMLVLLLSCVITFTLARTLSARWRKRRSEREQEERRRNESRQVRRARQRKSSRRT